MFSRKAATALLSIAVLGASTNSPVHASSGKSEAIPRPATATMAAQWSCHSNPHEPR
jgi:hypothetical protein